MTAPLPWEDPLPAALRALRQRAGADTLFAAFDLGARWSVLSWGEGPSVPAGPAWRSRARALLKPDAAAPTLPFSGGLVGWLGYELGATVEQMPAPRAAPPLPDLGLWRVAGGLCWDRLNRRWQVGGSAAFCREAEALLAGAEAPGGPAPAPRTAPDAAAWAERDRRAQKSAYEDAVRAVLNAIAAGDVYQVNIAWEDSALLADDPLDTWLALRRSNPARRGAFLAFGDQAILSNSPELYLSVRRRAGRLVARSAPIKGTADAAGGRAAKEALRRSEKERAELTMIVDLVRNDLSRVARVGGVSAGPRRLVRCGDLWHAEQSVHAVLARGRDAFDAVAASFPPGSVTGAPKVAAMKIIHDLEPGPRGVYTGAIGLFADGGEAHLSVAIRTATVQGARARFHVGAGLVADSVPALEWAETLAKGRALAAALEGR